MLCNQIGFALIELAKAQADARALASAISIYSAHMGMLPTALTDLTSAAVNGANQSAGPFMASVPAPPATWSAYAYTSSTAGTLLGLVRERQRRRDSHPAVAAPSQPSNAKGGEPSPPSLFVLRPCAT